MTSNSSNRIYLGTINPGGSLTQSGSASVRTRPFTTPAAPGRASFGSSTNALTVLSSHPTSSKNTISPQDEDLVVIEDEVSSASSSFSSRDSSRRSSASSETISSVSVNTPIRQEAPKTIPVPAPLFVDRKELFGQASAGVGAERPPCPQPAPSITSSAASEAVVDEARRQIAQSSSSAVIAEASSKRARPILDSTKQKSKDKGSLSPKRMTQKDTRSKKEAVDARKPLAKSSSPVATSSKLVSSNMSSEDKRRPATAGVTSRPKCVSLGRKELIGKGSFGMVYKALDLETNRLLAVKEIPLDGPNLQQLPTVRREILLMEKLSHPNIVQCLGHDLDEQYLRIYMEFVAGGCVSSLLKNFGRFQERQASIVTKQVLSGLQYLHDRKIAHRDLKGDNILLQPDGTVKLADFGTARELATTAMSLAGTAYFMAPEMIKGTGHGLEADIWSVGCCIIEMLTGKPPFSHLVNQYAIMTHVAESDGPFDDAFPKNCSPQVIKILRQCLVKDPSKRATCRQLLDEEWIVNPPPNAEMKGPLILEQTVSEVRDRGRQGRQVRSVAPSKLNSNDSSAIDSKPKSIRGDASQPLSSFNPMIEEE